VNIPDLARAHHVIGVDLPGFGQSSRLAGPARIQTYAEVLASLLDWLGIDRAVVIGHAMGDELRALRRRAPRAGGWLMFVGSGALRSCRTCWQGRRHRGLRDGIVAAVTDDFHRSHHRTACPTLILSGRADRAAPVQLAERLASLIPGAQLEVWEDAGHCPIHAHPERFNERVRDWSAAQVKEVAA
jgi:pimeloyl-ACP methyl ester carboxylesterase